MRRFAKNNNRTNTVLSPLSKRAHHYFRCFPALAIAALLSLPLSGSAQDSPKSPQNEIAPAKSDSLATTEKDRTDLAITVYNSSVALIRDTRQINLAPGLFPLRFEDVAASINPVTVHFRSVTDPAKLSVVEQNYEYDLLDPQKLMEKYVGREVTLVEGAVEKKALLLSDNNGQVWKIDDQIVTGVPTGTFKFPDLPGNLYTRPTLIWTLDNRGSVSQRVEASYMTGNMNWNADYVLTVTRDEKAADLDGWVTLTNNSGASFENAKLQLVAGKIHQVTPRPLPMAAKSMSMAVEVSGAAQAFSQEAFSEYHLYTLDRRTSIHNNESKQISLLNGTGVPIEKFLLVEGEPYFYRNSMGIGNAIPQTVKVYYRFRNDQKSGLGMPLPAGTVRVYQADSKGGVQFVGEDNIEHTPKDETLKIYTGDAFDIVCDRKETDYKKLASNLYEMEYAITLRNHKDGPVTVEVREPIGGDWEIENSNFKWAKLDSTTVGFEIPVAKDGTETLTYRVRVKW
jgi:hypothetical protein